LFRSKLPPLVSNPDLLVQSRDRYKIIEKLNEIKEALKNLKPEEKRRGEKAMEELKTLIRFSARPKRKRLLRHYQEHSCNNLRSSSR
jgi:hypothetical protein